MSFFENTRKPVGLWRENYGRHDESRAQPRGTVGASISECCAGRQGAGLRLRRRGEHEKAAEKMPAGHRQGHRLFARQRGEVEKGQRGRHRGGPLRRSARQRGGYDVC